MTRKWIAACKRDFYVNSVRRGVDDTIEEFNVDSKAEYSASSSTRSHKNIQKKKLKQMSVPL